ncbi:hypothetical protein Phi46:3_gp105 [Cellulophaga phage phi46:3]|uniref:Uncharacterized protein n=1 Tax=Cellulophaga phage phi46:3 TaxID=1327985 RepID=R9ZZT6_9CAUD|nr:hypothetical protein Phi46:3_gp105 [Cellulophaga phage phi46:3]AGO48849.1 hypothetical protein Phi46:3_gp105 [Cellulophaga phage phi46:3]
MKVLDKTMVEYTLELDNNLDGVMKSEVDFMSLAKYAKFLSQEIKLEMFVPCKDGVPLSEPTDMYNGDQYFGSLMDEYQEAKEKVLFEGDWEFERDDRYHWITYLIDKSKEDKIIRFNEIKTIEDLIPYKLKLTKEI